MTDIVQVQTAEDLEEIRKLFMEYAESLGFDLCFQGFDDEMRTLPGAYAPPNGGLFAAKHGEETLGCVAFRPLDPNICEMKRLYVKSEHRGNGIARRLAQTAIDQADRIGYRSMRLDTVPSMKPAILLYASMGFKQIPPYCHNPIPGAMFFELHLAKD